MNRKQWLTAIVAIIFLTTLAVALDIPVLRQVLGFICLALLPGALILVSLRLSRLDMAEQFVLAVGISIAFIMVFGLLIDQLYFVLGYITPLSANSVIFSLTPILLLLAFIGYKRTKETSFTNIFALRFNSKEKLLLIVPSIFPFMGIFGVYLMNITNNNVVLMVLLFLIPLYIAFVSIYHRKVPDRLYPIIIMMISISVILLFALRSNHIMGTDTHDEYYYFQLTLSNLHWTVKTDDLLAACISISLLPTIFQSILNIDAEFVFKVLYSLLFSISPLIVYLLAKRYISSFYAFLAAVLYLSLTNFLQTEMHARTNIAILFFALALLVIFHDRIGAMNKRILFPTFLIAVLFSHYSTTYIFFIILCFSCVGIEVISKVPFLRERFGKVPRHPTSKVRDSRLSLQQKAYLDRNIGLIWLPVLFTMIYLWYGLITQKAFTIGVSYVLSTLQRLQRFFILEAREPAQELLSPAIAPTIPAKIQYFLTWAIFAFIAVGVIALLIKYKEGILSDSGTPRLKFLRERFGAEYYLVVLACVLVLLYFIVFPTAGGRLYSADRTYTQTMILLSPFFIIGGITISRYLKLPAYALIILVLIPFFMCTSGTIYQVAGIHKEVTLNSDGYKYDHYYIHDRESHAARWLGNHADKQRIRVYTGGLASNILTSQGGIPQEPLYRFISPLPSSEPMEKGSFIFLGYEATTKSKIIVDGEKLKLSDYPYILAMKNKIYANSGAEIYK